MIPNLDFFQKQMISEVDENMSGSIDFGEFLKVVERQKEQAENFDDEEELIDAFVACGGNEDKSGFVEKDTLISKFHFIWISDSCRHVVISLYTL